MKQTNIAQKNSGNKPELNIKAGGVSATVWRNTGESNGKTYDFYMVTIERTYLDPKSKEFKKTSQFRINDLPKVNLVCTKAFEYLSLKEQEVREEE